MIKKIGIILLFIIMFLVCIGSVFINKGQNIEKIENKVGIDTLSIDTLPLLTKTNVLVEIVKQDIKFPLIVLKQGILETGWFKCTNCSLDYNNLFGLKTTKYYENKHWINSIKNYKIWQDKVLPDTVKTENDYYEFLYQYRYARDSIGSFEHSRRYVNTLKQIRL